MELVCGVVLGFRMDGCRSLLQLALAVGRGDWAPLTLILVAMVLVFQLLGGSGRRPGEHLRCPEGLAMLEQLHQNEAIQYQQQSSRQEAV